MGFLSEHVVSVDAAEPETLLGSAVAVCSVEVGQQGGAILMAYPEFPGIGKILW